jgi:hypothetical protein
MVVVGDVNNTSKTKDAVDTIYDNVKRGRRRFRFSLRTSSSISRILLMTVTLLVVCVVGIFEDEGKICFWVFYIS